MSDQTTLVPDTIEGVWSNYPVICAGVGQGCSHPATVMVRAENHSCQRHDGRFYFKCGSCLDIIIDNQGGVCQFQGDRKIAVVEVRDLPS